MPATQQLTLDMCLVELQRIRSVMQKNYPNMVREHKITPYQRDQRFAVIDKLISLIRQAKANKNSTKANLYQLINQLP